MPVSSAQPKRYTVARRNLVPTYGLGGYGGDAIAVIIAFDFEAYRRATDALLEAADNMIRHNDGTRYRELQDALRRYREEVGR